MGGLSTGLAPEWLALRENADAAARATDLLARLSSTRVPGSNTRVPGSSTRVPGSGAEPLIRDLGCGTGAMGRWLSGRLPGRQRWVLHDRDPGLLRVALESFGVSGRVVSVTAVPGDLAGLRTADLAGTSLVTASALLDLLTAAEVEALAAACLGAGCPALLTLTVLGRVVFDPPDPLDVDLAAAFNAHQRRDDRLGPSAFEVAAEAFARGAVVYREPSPWRLGPTDTALTAEWLHGWVSAAVEQLPTLAGPARSYLDRRLEAIAAGALRVTVSHADLLALPEVAR
ncbi:MAG TPA: class I SAM-dependent methyltransferase [Actinophytocola sp.]|uniref:class I SAM-dependent methyltransferase n=1 Tax=Actinophytocola sp. TaxID=1872138 RepID=UPI002E08D09D|nr:class I SAM-dependent methyltransferase [Actinophytocola sp.]